MSTILIYILSHPHCSYREIVAACGLSSTSVARYHVRKLIAAWLVAYTPGIARSLHCPDPLHTAAALLVARAERRGGYAVVPWAAIEAMRELIG